MSRENDIQNSETERCPAWEGPGGQSSTVKTQGEGEMCHFY